MYHTHNDIEDEEEDFFDGEDEQVGSEQTQRVADHRSMSEQTNAGDVNDESLPGRPNLSTTADIMVKKNELSEQQQNLEQRRWLQRSAMDNTSSSPVTAMASGPSPYASGDEDDYDDSIDFIDNGYIDFGDIFNVEEERQPTHASGSNVIMSGAACESALAAVAESRRDSGDSNELPHGNDESRN